MSSIDFQFHLVDLPNQELLVEVHGPAAHRIRRGLLHDPAALEELPDLSALAMGPADPELPLADVVELFLRGLDAGLFHAASPRPGSLQGWFVADEFDPVGQIKRWRLCLRDIHPGAFRVLRNLLRAFPAERVVLRTSPDVSGGRSITDLLSQPYPPRARILPFPVSRSANLPDGECNAVRLTFREPLDVPVEEKVIAGFEAWAHLLILGGYLSDEAADKGRLGAAPNLPSLIDPHTIEMTFDVFNSDMATLDAAVNLAHRLHQTMAPVESLQFE